MPEYRLAQSEGQQTTMEHNPALHLVYREVGVTKMRDRIPVEPNRLLLLTLALLIEEVFLDHSELTKMWKRGGRREYRLQPEKL
jgi:hypothetical protein